MRPGGLVGSFQAKEYEENCKQYDEIIKMFAELGSGKMDRQDVLNNITNMINNGLLIKLEDLVTDITNYELYGGLYL